jgi:ABC-2 type transport system ATP-binding protein
MSAPDGRPATQPAVPGWDAAPDPGRRTATFAGPAPAPTGAPVELLGVSRWYGNVVAVNEVTFSLDAGITGLLGPNGAGKSTILSMISGLLRPSNGTVAIEGRSTWRDPSMYRRVGIVPERESLPGFLSGRAFVEYNARLQGMADPRGAAARAIEEVDLAPSADRDLAGYSKGMRQRIKVAAALVHDPRILVLDEPFNGMDPRQRLHMMELLRRMADEGRVILFSSHILEEVERLGERILVIVAGRLAASGDYREIRRLMTDRPHTFTIRSSDDRRMASVLMAEASVFGVEVSERGILARTADFGGFSRAIARVAQGAGVSLWEVVPTDESLESVFSYLVRR